MQYKKDGAHYPSCVHRSWCQYHLLFDVEKKMILGSSEGTARLLVELKKLHYHIDRLDAGTCPYMLLEWPTRFV